MDRQNSIAQLVMTIDELSAIVEVGQDILDTHGITAGELKDAGVFDKLQALEGDGGRLYRDALPHAHFLLGGEEGVEKIREQLVDAIFPIGFLGPLSIRELINELKRGWAPDTNYYPVIQLERLLAMLKADKQNV